MATARAGRPNDDDSVAALVARAAAGDEGAWGSLVDRFAPLVMSMCRGFHLGDADAFDVAQGVWLALLEHLAEIREPNALPGWIRTTARHECLHLVSGKGGRQRQELVGDVDSPTVDLREQIDEQLLVAERRTALREALHGLRPDEQALILLLIEDPPLSYAEIGRRRKMAVGSIGPTRGRLLEKIRSHPAVAALLDSTPPPRPPNNTQGN